jgi:glyoxylase-like metal-dependent hydrolase (beta-lactamase superfamily II)
MPNAAGAGNAPRVLSCLAPIMLRFVLLLAASLLAPSVAHALDAVAVAPGVYAFLGDVEQPSVENGGDTGNAGFIVGDDGVVVIDTGASYRRGGEMLAAIARVTDRPVRLVIVTHAMQEFIFGSAAFAERSIPLLAHRETAELMRKRCAHCLENLVALLGEARMAGTRVVLPGHIADASTTIEVAGRTLELLHFGWAATPGDLAVLDPASGVLFAGGLVTSLRVPELRDGRLDGWLAALAGLEAREFRIVVPGHGPIAGRAAIAATSAYLRALDERARRLFASGRSLLEAVDDSALPAYAAWGSYAVLNRRNLQQRYLEYEVRELEAK